MTSRFRLAGPGEAGRTGGTARLLLLASVALTVLLDVVPYGRTIGRPLLLISTVVHEMGHGVAGTLVGRHLVALKIYADGSGLAPISYTDSRLAVGFTAAGGLCGPAVFAGMRFLLGTRLRLAAVSLFVLGCLALLVDVVFVRSLFGVVFVGALGLTAVVIARKASRETSQLGLLLLAVQLSLSVFSRSDYLFVEVARTAGGTFPSDVANMSTALSGPYWFWGAMCGGFSIVTLLLGVWMFFRATRGSDRSPRVS